MALSDFDRKLLQSCLERRPRSWEDFVDRFMGLVIHVVNHSAEARHAHLSQADRDDLCAEVFLHIIKDDFGVLRRFRGKSSLATYLTVVARRVVVREFLKRYPGPDQGNGASPPATAAVADSAPSPEQRLADREEVERLLNGLEGNEAKVVRMFHLDGKSYREISTQLGVPENSIGPILSRARAKLRDAASVAATK